MYYVSEHRDILEDYNAKVAAGENYDGEKTIRWADVIEHHEGGQFAILKHPSYPLTDGQLDDFGNPIDQPTVESIADFYPPLELVNE